MRLWTRGLTFWIHRETFIIAAPFFTLSFMINWSEGTSKAFCRSFCINQPNHTSESFPVATFTRVLLHGEAKADSILPLTEKVIINFDTVSQSKLLNQIPELVKLKLINLSLVFEVDFTRKAQNTSKMISNKHLKQSYYIQLCFLQTLTRPWRTRLWKQDAPCGHEFGNIAEVLKRLLTTQRVMRFSLLPQNGSFMVHFLYYPANKNKW